MKIEELKKASKLLFGDTIKWKSSKIRHTDFSRCAFWLEWGEDLGDIKYNTETREIIEED